ncbi:MAG: response regulator [Methylococcales bacterium]|nr:response regulator [Methylococcales bacterium]
MTEVDEIHIFDLSILLIEPSKTQLKVIKNHLTEEGISNIDCATSGKEALESIRKYQPDLIISSMYLADMTAVDLLEKIKKTDSIKDTPFMLISSEVRLSVLDPIRQAGVVAILPKPFKHDGLKRALRTAVEFLDPKQLLLDNFDVEDIRVLLVDDSLMARKHIIRVLNGMGIIHITQAKDGREGLDIFSQLEDRIDLIVTDLNMPEMDGIELTEAIRNELDNPYIPILMVTSENNEARLNNVHQAGITSIFDKPFDPKTVKEVLKQVLDEI